MFVGIALQITTTNLLGALFIVSTPACRTKPYPAITLNVWMNSIEQQKFHLVVIFTTQN